MSGYSVELLRRLVYEYDCKNMNHLVCSSHLRRYRVPKEPTDIYQQQIQQYSTQYPNRKPLRNGINNIKQSFNSSPGNYCYC